MKYMWTSLNQYYDNQYYQHYISNFALSTPTIESICIAFRYMCHPPGGVVGNMLASHAVNPGSIPGRGIHSDSDDHYNGGPVSLDPQWHIKDPWRR